MICLRLVGAFLKFVFDVDLILETFSRPKRDPFRNFENFLTSFWKFWEFLFENARGYTQINDNIPIHTCHTSGYVIVEQLDVNNRLWLSKKWHNQLIGRLHEQNIVTLVPFKSTFLWKLWTFWDFSKNLLRFEMFLKIPFLPD